MTNQNRIRNLQEQLSRHVGIPVDITIRGERAFTFSTDKVTPELEDRIRTFFGQVFALTTKHDPECGSFCYADLRASHDDLADPHRQEQMTAAMDMGLTPAEARMFL